MAYRHYPGGAAPFWCFHGSFLILAAASSLLPLRYGLATLAGFLALGHWLKAMAYFALGTTLIEPIGAFDGSGASWDRALGLITAGVAGVSAAILIDYRWRRPESAEIIRVPRLFLSHARGMWVVTGVGIMVLAAWNITAAFAMIGVNLRQTLPLRLHIVISYWLFFGSSIWIAVLLQWERAARGTLRTRWLAIPFLEALIPSATVLSRSIFLLRMIPYGLTMATGEGPIRRPRGWRAIAVAGALALGLAGSLVMTSLARAYVFTRPAGGWEDSLDQQWHQIPNLFLARWTGLEGALAFSSVPEHGRPTLGAVLLEHPSRGTEAIYQRVAHSEYPVNDEFTFLTLAGILGIASAGGSRVQAAAIAFAAAALLLLLEALTRRMIGGGITAAATGVTAASVIAQTTFRTARPSSCSEPC
jgi:hypothetical protein